MTKDDVVAIRKALKLKDTNPLIEIIMDNGMFFSEATHQVIWDDEKDRVVALYVENGPLFREHPIRVIATEYEHIQYIGTRIPLDKLDSIYTELTTSGIPVTAEDRKDGTSYFTRILDPRDLAREEDSKGYL